MEKEEPDKVPAFKIMLYYATGAALLVIPDWLPMNPPPAIKKTAGAIWQAIVAVARLGNPLSPQRILLIYYYVSPFSNQNTANGFSKVHLAEYHNIAFLSRLSYRVERNRFFHNT